MEYSPKLSVFIEENLPLEKKISPEELRMMAKKARLGFFDRLPGFGEQMVVGLVGKNSATQLKQSAMIAVINHGVEAYTLAGFHPRHCKLRWVGKVQGEAVVYSPSLSVITVSNYQMPATIDKELLSKNNITDVKVLLPEPAVMLPQAPWAKEGNSFEQSQDPLTPVYACFASEAPDLVRPFIQHLLSVTGLSIEDILGQAE